MESWHIIPYGIKIFALAGMIPFETAGRKMDDENTDHVADEQAP